MPHSPGPQAPLTFHVAAGDDTFHGTGAGTRTGTGTSTGTVRARGSFAPTAPGPRPHPETTPLSGRCGLGHAPQRVLLAPRRRPHGGCCFLPVPPVPSLGSGPAVMSPSHPVSSLPGGSGLFPTAPRRCLPGFPRPPSQTASPLAGSAAPSRPRRQPIGRI